MRYRFIEEALNELIADGNYYNAQVPGLGEMFLDQVEDGITAILANPQTWRVIERDVRRYLVHRFPHGIYYTIENDVIIIWAIRNLHRDPETWKTRLTRLNG
jgi:toxin ParE1/3/4